MYEYEFVRCPVEVSVRGVETASHKQVIEAHAAKGWRLVQVLIQLPAAVPQEYELIFERPHGSAAAG